MFTGWRWTASTCEGFRNVTFWEPEYFIIINRRVIAVLQVRRGFLALVIARPAFQVSDATPLPRNYILQQIPRFSLACGLVTWHGITMAFLHVYSFALGATIPHTDNSTSVPPLVDRFPCVARMVCGNLLLQEDVIHQYPERGVEFGGFPVGAEGPREDKADAIRLVGEERQSAQPRTECVGRMLGSGVGWDEREHIPDADEHDGRRKRGGPRGAVRE
ncbi:hypothetical protein JB92DRAFT_3097838 [Gautieria morchelliformis]|nr:hypothetical protein JB92DRAFT_3097838 [Gautieria morchelliformis]